MSEGKKKHTQTEKEKWSKEYRCADAVIRGDVCGWAAIQH